jgi:hypothetical protein
MKWARVKPTLEKVSQQDKADYEKSYKYYTLEELKNHETAKYTWVTHQFEYDFGNNDSYEKFQKRYELFCGGYLFYYDKHTRSNAVDHVLHFRWKPFNKKNIYTVTLYLWPEPDRTKSLTQDTAYNHISKTTAHIADHVPERMTSLSSQIQDADTQTVFAAHITTPTALAMETTTSDAGIDPPVPPNPGPPPRHES